jgi:hypothetical protein
MGAGSGGCADGRIRWLARTLGYVMTVQVIPSERLEEAWRRTAAIEPARGQLAGQLRVTGGGDRDEDAEVDAHQGQQRPPVRVGVTERRTQGVRLLPPPADS